MKRNCSDLIRILVKIQCLKECAHRSCMQHSLSAGTHVCCDQEESVGVLHFLSHTEMHLLELARLASSVCTICSLLSMVYLYE
jgi:hypothetical protein